MSRRQRPVRLPRPGAPRGVGEGDARVKFPVPAPPGAVWSPEAADGLVGQVIDVNLPGALPLRRPVLAAVYESPERIVVTVAVPSSVVMPSGPNRPPNVLQSPPLGEDDDG